MRRLLTVLGVTLIAAGVYVSARSANAEVCDPNYAGTCVPIAEDVDCFGGGGDGPLYVKGPLLVVGEDIYGLDSNTEFPDDLIGCEADQPGGNLERPSA
jgi:hypothetical protein